MRKKNGFKARVLALATGAAMFAASGCQIDGWKLAFGPAFSAGVELEFSNGANFIVPIVAPGIGLFGN
jgi:hypothetical protein